MTNPISGNTNKIMSQATVFEGLRNSSTRMVEIWKINSNSPITSQNNAGSSLYLYVLVHKAYFTLKEDFVTKTIASSSQTVVSTLPSAPNAPPLNHVASPCSTFSNE